MGCAAARTAAGAGHEVMLSSRRGPERLRDLAGTLGAGVRAVPVATAMECPLVLLAVPWPAVEATLRANPGTPDSVLMDATNAWDDRPPRTAEGGTSEAVAGWTRAAVVRVFSTVHARRLAAPDGLGVPYATDVPAAGEVVAGFLRTIGFSPVHAGSLRATAVSMAPGGPLFGHTVEAGALARAISS